ncbi:MAG: hypothetical protein QMB20_02940 [Flavobacteriales bacterium]
MRCFVTVPILLLSLFHQTPHIPLFSISELSSMPDPVTNNPVAYAMCGSREW